MTVKEFITSKGIKSLFVAKKLNMSKQNFSYLSNKELRLLSYEQLKIIANIVNLKVEDIINA